MRILVAALAAAATLHPVAAAPSYVPVSGAGSTWSANALRQWGANVRQYGMVVNYAATGSTDGRSQFRYGTVDYGVSEIPYGLRDSIAGQTDPPPQRKYAYMPIVAGGTAFMYHLTIGGRRVTNLRLSGDVVAKIFTGVIKTWNDPAIAADNPGLALPARRIVPVVRSDGSGTTAQFTLWLSKEHPQVWNAYCARRGKPTPCGLTSYFPYDPREGFVAKSGSDNVSGYVRQAHGEGGITYVEYSYAVNAGFPAAKVLNRSGYYIEPKAANVAVGLLKAEIQDDNPNAEDYLTQKLDGVYRNEDPRAYPLSSYSYMVLPTALENGITTNKGYTLGAFGYYFLCEGQQQADSLGYSPLPINLVQAGFAQLRRIPGVEERAINIAGCNNPTFSRDGTNTLARNAPQPPACDRKGVTQCAVGGGPATVQGGPTAGNPSAGPSSNPSTGPDSSGPGAGPGGAGGPEFAAGIPVSLDAERGWRLRHTMMLLAGLLLAGIVVGPPLLSRHLRRRERP